MGKDLSTDDTLIFIVLIVNYTFDPNMFTESGFHCEDNWTVGINDGAVSDFDFAIYWELK
uniref:Uncharacterized protein n=1 Tax=Romanomermis culicivorax TaxID=13658 RepID=A0A915JP00_ROMCU